MSRGREKLRFGGKAEKLSEVGEKMIKIDKKVGDWTKEKGICPLCGSRHFKVFYEEPRGYACPECGISFRLPLKAKCVRKMSRKHHSRKTQRKKIKRAKRFRKKQRSTHK